MDTYPLDPCVDADPDMEDGYVRRPGGRRRLFPIYMTEATWQALALTRGALPRLHEVIGDREGTFLIPRAVIEPEAASDLRLGLTLADPEPSEYCAYGPCILRATQVHPDGFSLCDTHTALMADWDDLVAG